jgi:hypothetical protein
MRRYCWRGAPASLPVSGLLSGRRTPRRLPRLAAERNSRPAQGCRRPTFGGPKVGGEFVTPPDNWSQVAQRPRRLVPRRRQDCSLLICQAARKLCRRAAGSSPLAPAGPLVAAPHSSVQHLMFACDDDDEDGAGGAPLDDRRPPRRLCRSCLRAGLSIVLAKHLSRHQQLNWRRPHKPIVSARRKPPPLSQHSDRIRVTNTSSLST